MVVELVFLVDLARRGTVCLAAAERTRRPGLTRCGVGGSAAAGTCGDLIAGYRSRLADQAAAGAAHQIDVDMVLMVTVGARRQHGIELLAGGGLHVAQKSLLFGHAAPAALDGDTPAVCEREGRDI